MPNLNKPFGLKPVRYASGGRWTGGGTIYCIRQSNTQAFAIGDPVTLEGEADANGIPSIVLATAGTGNPVLGAIVSGAGAPTDAGSFGVPADSPLVIPASKTRNYYVLVADDPDVVFEVQENSSGGAIAASSVGLNVNLASGTNNGFVSGWTLASSSVATGATLQMKLLRAVRRPDNELGNFCKWECLINHHVFRGGTTGI